MIAAAVGRNLRRVRRESRERGALPVLGACAGWGLAYARGRLRLATGRERPGRFRFGGRDYPYFHHPYRFTWLNERAVEVPIFGALLEEHSGGPVLEVGNVLAHYLPATRDRDVVDRYERATGVVNEDVLRFRPPTRYPLIVSISTLEHVGWDEEPRDPEKAAAAIEHLGTLLAPGGRLVFSVPLGYNPELDRRLRGGDVALSSTACLRRTEEGWREAACGDVWDAQYDSLLYQASAVLIGTLERPA